LVRLNGLEAVNGPNDAGRDLKDMREYGASLLKAIPAKPEPPSTDLEGMFLDPAKNAEFTRQVEAFSAGVTNVLEPLRALPRTGP